MIMLLVLCVFGASFAPVMPLPWGAPRAACGSMLPDALAPGRGHTSFPQTTSSPYQLTFTHQQGGSYSVRLTGSQPFKGFFIQAKDDKGNAVGSFRQLDPRITQTVDCGGIGFNEEALTHTDSSDKTEVTAIWSDEQALLRHRAPRNVHTFVATVVKDINTYWAAVDGRNIDS